MSEATQTPAQPVATPTAATPTPAAPETAKPASAAVVTPVPDALKPAPAAPAPESKPDGQAGVKPDEDKGGKDGKTGDAKSGTNAPEAKTAVVPEKYEFTVPEGFELDKTLVDQFTPIAKEAKLDQPTAQKFVDMYAGIKKAENDAHEKIRNDWKEATLKELGTNAPEQLANVAKVRERLLSKEFNDIIENSGLGNHPAVVRDLIKLGKAISEDVSVHGSDKPAVTTGPQTMYNAPK